MKFEKKVSFLLIGLIIVGGVTIKATQTKDIEEFTDSNNVIAVNESKQVDKDEFLKDKIQFELDSSDIVGMQQHADENGKISMNVAKNINVDTSNYNFIDNKYVLNSEQSREFFYEMQLYSFEQALTTNQMPDEEIAQTLGLSEDEISKMSQNQIVNEYAIVLNNLMDTAPTEIVG